MRTTLLLSLVLLLLTKSAEAQIGVTVCGCQPSNITFGFAFSNDVSLCGTPTIPSGEGTGVQNITCSTTGTGNTPVVNKKIVISEKGQDGTAISLDRTIIANLTDGDGFRYDNVLIAEKDKIDTVQEIPLAFVIVMTGEDADGGAVEQTVEFTFTNDCSIYPVLKANDGAVGWISIIDIPRGAEVEFCSEAAPSAMPSLAPSSAPTSTAEPTGSPDPGPTSGGGDGGGDDGDGNDCPCKDEFRPIRLLLCRLFHARKCR